MVELADTLDLGSNGIAVQVQVLLPAPNGVFITDLSYGHSFFISIASFHICIEQDLSRSFVLCSLAAYLTATLIRVAALYQLLRCLKLNLSG